MSGAAPGYREIPFNYTSADDAQVVSLLLGDGAWETLQELRSRRVTGRSARLLMRVLGELFIHRRNAYLFEELLASPKRQAKLLGDLEADLAGIEEKAAGQPLVGRILASARALLGRFEAEIREIPALRSRLRRTLAPIVGAANVHVDPFTIVAHATDATDWRLHLPFAVVRPSEEAEVPPLLSAIAGLGLYAIPRGAGTGLTGGAVPLRSRCVVVNTEALHRIRGIERRTFTSDGGGPFEGDVMALEAGVVTERAMEEAEEHGLVFATDPTSAWACTIGGNIAENAGGKTAVLWGTCIDNLLSWKTVLPDGRVLVTTREGHPFRKILPSDTLRFSVADSAGGAARTVALAGEEARRPGLWKDITNKVLGGLPGLQKEGTDGIVTSAEFVLHPRYAESRTLCVEFFGPDFDEASRVILELDHAFPNRGEEVLQALEHFDDEYVRAIGYRTKAARAETPRAVVLIDVVGRSPSEVERGLKTIREIASRHPGMELFVAADAAEAKLYWNDRKKLGAIARRTNAFKLNEDIVLPLSALAEFARFCDARNTDEERTAQRDFAEGAVAALEAAPPRSRPERFEEKLARARALRDETRTELSACDAPSLRSVAAAEKLRGELLGLFRGSPALEAAVEAAFRRARERRIVLATHMHAGDGNVHVNIPVLSNDLRMMRRAERAVDDVMAEVARLGGVCSGEHGIGVTKLKYLEPERIAALDAYRRKIDPAGTMNPGKLSDLPASLSVFTPSFNLLELEAHILRHAQLGELAEKVATCVRCGKCKPDCCVFYPQKGLHFHPRNKNLAVGALVEALLYDAQRERSARFALLPWLTEVADHCTLCHKCAKPCPVDIDTADVSILERQILAAREARATPPPVAAALAYLATTSRLGNRLLRGAIVTVGGAAQRFLHGAVTPLLPTFPPVTGPLAVLRSPVPKGDEGTLRDLLPESGPDEALVFETDRDATATVFYFPGCGSERLYSTVSMAAIHLLLETGTRVVLPPPFLCCGFPHRANAWEEAHGKIVLKDVIVFSQIRAMLRHLTFDAVVVTCGTCMEALETMAVEEIFGCEVLDALAFASRRGLNLPKDGTALYHTPCHDSFGGSGLRVLASTLGVSAAEAPHCCSEAGTLALSRPDIAESMRHRKREALVSARGEGAGEPDGPRATVLTNCPSCLTGLKRNEDLCIEVRHVAVEAAWRLSPDWRDAFAARAKSAARIRF
jgi:FAD/FMN-containing dehydrogenase/Fe-S oxidoreductase